MLVEPGPGADHFRRGGGEVVGKQAAIEQCTWAREGPDRGDGGDLRGSGHGLGEHRVGHHRDPRSGGIDDILRLIDMRPHRHAGGGGDLREVAEVEARGGPGGEVGIGQGDLQAVSLRKRRDVLGSVSINKATQRAVVERFARVTSLRSEERTGGPDPRTDQGAGGDAIPKRKDLLRAAQISHPHHAPGQVGGEVVGQGGADPGSGAGVEEVGVGVDESGDDGVTGQIVNGSVVGPASASIHHRPDLIAGNHHRGVFAEGVGIEDADPIEDDGIRWPYG